MCTNEMILNLNKEDARFRKTKHIFFAKICLYNTVNPCDILANGLASEVIIARKASGRAYIRNGLCVVAFFVIIKSHNNMMTENFCRVLVVSNLGPLVKTVERALTTTQPRDTMQLITHM